MIKARSELVMELYNQIGKSQKGFKNLLDDKRGELKDQDYDDCLSLIEDYSKLSSDVIRFVVSERVQAEIILDAKDPTIRSNTYIKFLDQNAPIAVPEGANNEIVANDGVSLTQLQTRVEQQAE